MKTAKILREKLAGPGLTLGVLATHHVWPGLLEVVRRAGLDYLIIDLEHLTHDHEKVADICAMGRMLDFPVLIRPPAAEVLQVRLAADLGPCGLLVPYVEVPADMAAIQDGIYLKPRGKRRPGGPAVRTLNNLNYQGWKSEVEDHFIILPQIESKAGLANLEAIARHPITTAMAMGPYDLSADLGLCWQPTHPDLLGAQANIQAAARAAGKTTWAIGDPADLVKRGFTFLCITEPVMALEGLLKDMVGKLRA